MSETFTKLFGSITDSTIWAEDHPTRLVWITMLAMADRNGYVGASVPGLANRARVTVEECAAALEKFASPDVYSRSQEHGGRRIETADRGWVLLNYERFRDMRDEEARKEYERNRKRESRRRKSAGVPDNTGQSGNVPVCLPVSAQAEAEAEAEAEAHTQFMGPPHRLIPPPDHARVEADRALSLAESFAHEINASRPPGCREYRGKAELARMADMLASYGLPKCRDVVLDVARRVGADLEPKHWSMLWAKDGDIFRIRLAELEARGVRATQPRKEWQPDNTMFEPEPANPEVLARAMRVLGGET